MLLLPLSFQSAVGFEYAGKTEKHASQRGDVTACCPFARLLQPQITCSLVWLLWINPSNIPAVSETWGDISNTFLNSPSIFTLFISSGFINSLSFPNWRLQETHFPAVPCVLLLCWSEAAWALPGSYCNVWQCVHGVGQLSCCICFPGIL